MENLFRIVLHFTIPSHNTILAQLSSTADKVVSSILSFSKILEKSMRDRMFRLPDFNRIKINFISSIILEIFSCVLKYLKKYEFRINQYYTNVILVKTILLK